MREHKVFSERNDMASVNKKISSNPSRIESHVRGNRCPFNHIDFRFKKQL